MQIVEYDVTKWVKGGRKHTSQSKYDPDLRTWVQRKRGTGIGTVVLGRGSGTIESKTWLARVVCCFDEVRSFFSSDFQCFPFRNQRVNIC